MPGLLGTNKPVDFINRCTMSNITSFTCNAGKSSLSRAVNSYQMCWFLNEFTDTIYSPHENNCIRLFSRGLNLASQARPHRKCPSIGKPICYHYGNNNYVDHIRRKFRY